MLVTHLTWMGGMGLHMTGTGEYGFRGDGDGRGMGLEVMGWVSVSVPVQTSILGCTATQATFVNFLKLHCLCHYIIWQW